MSTLSDRLRSLGVKVGAKDISPPPKRENFPIERVLPGSFIETDLGQTYVVEEEYPTNYPYGKGALLPASPIIALEKWAKEPGLCNLEAGAIAYLDTETSGLAGGTGTFAFLVGAGRFEDDHFHLAQFFMRDPSEEGALLLALEKFLAPCRALVSFNGKAFDAPLLNTRYTLAGWRSPLSSMQHVDLLPLARRLWRDRLPSRTLGNLEVQILEMKRTEEEVPGWMIPQMYFNYLRSGDAREMRRVFYHNALDVLSLAALFSHITGLLADPLHCPETHRVDRAAMGRLFEDLGEDELAAQLYETSLQDPGDFLSNALYWETLQRLSFLHKRQGNYPQAMHLWEEAARNDQLYAHVELAKVFEHILHDYHQALRWTQQAIQTIRRAGLPIYEKALWKSELEHRQERLMRKIANGDSSLSSD